MSYAENNRRAPPDWRSGRIHDANEWMQLGWESVKASWRVLIAQKELTPRSLSGIGDYAYFEQREDIHPLIWAKPDVLEKLNGKSQVILAFMAPSGGGKDTILRTLMTQYPLSEVPFTIIVTATSKEPRAEDKDGETYTFLSQEKFDTMIREGKFLEYVHQFSKSYGTPRHAVEQSMTQGKPIIVWRGEYMGWLAMKHKLIREFPHAAVLSLTTIPKMSLFELWKWIIQKRSKEDWFARGKKAILEIIAGESDDFFLENPIAKDGPVEAILATKKLFEALAAEVQIIH